VRLALPWLAAAAEAVVEVHHQVELHRQHPHHRERQLKRQALSSISILAAL
jgi:hypothetical protein